MTYKVALAIAIIRNKPKNISAQEFTKLLQMNFSKAYLDNKAVIKALEKTVLSLTQ